MDCQMLPCLLNVFTARHIPDFDHPDALLVRLTDSPMTSPSFISWSVRDSGVCPRPLPHAACNAELAGTSPPAVLLGLMVEELYGGQNTTSFRRR